MSSAQPPVAVGYADRYDPDLDFDRWYTAATGEAMAAWLRPGDSVLEFGSATGAMTEIFAREGAAVVCVEREPAYLDRARARGLRGVELVLADVEAFECDRRFDHVVAANLVHEVIDVDRFFVRCAGMLQPHGRLHISLQNPDSIHRLVGQAGRSGHRRDAISERGAQFDTLRMLHGDQLVELGARAGLRCVHRSGVMLKPLPNALMETLPHAVLQSFVDASHVLPNNCAMNYLVFASGTGR